MNKADFRALGLRLDVENGEVYVDDLASVKVPYEYGVRIQSVTGDEEERYAAYTAIETELADDDDVWDALYNAYMDGKVLNAAGVAVSMDAAVELMDDDIREAVAADITPCTEQEFFDAYCEAHRKAYGEEFEPNKANPVF